MFNCPALLRLRGGIVLGVSAPLSAHSVLHWFWGGRLGYCPGEDLCAPVGVPLPLDPLRPAGGVDQQVLQELAAA
jgi:hypothetical protein